MPKARLMGVLLALVSALSYGLADFVGGVVSRRASPWAVAVTTSAAGAVCTLPLLALLHGTPSAADLVWGAVGGLGSGTGIGFLYRGFERGRMGVVGPVSGVGAAVVPVLAGVLGGERPALIVWSGILLALPAIWLVSSEPVGTRSTSSSTLADGLADGVLAGLGFGLLFACLGQVGDGAGATPLLLAYVLSVPTIVVVALALGGDWRPSREALPAALVGPLGALATLSFLLATQSGLLAVVGVISSLYPAGTVLLAAVLLRERVHRVQGWGLLMCAGSVVLVAAGAGPTVS